MIAGACGPGPAPPAPGLRVISLAPSVSRVIAALGATKALVAVDGFSHRLSEFAALPSVGGLFNPDLERTLELDPTLVIAVRSAQQNAYLDQLRRRGVRVEAIDPYTLEEVLASFGEIGAWLDREAEAQQLVSEIRLGLAEVREAVAGRGQVGVVLVVEREPLYVAGGGSFVDALIEIAGGRNLFGDLDAPFPRVGMEVLASRAPELILDTLYDPEAGPAAPEQVVAYWRRFGWVRRVEPFPPGMATLPGPELVEGARELAARIHPTRPEPGTAAPRAVAPGGA